MPLPDGAQLSSETLLSQATQLRSQGALSDAERILRYLAKPLIHTGFLCAQMSLMSWRKRKSLIRRRRIVNPGYFSKVATYELAVLLSQNGQHREADELLALLGFKFKLAGGIFDGNTSAKTAGASGVVVAYDRALPHAYYAALRKAFGPHSCFWSEHKYPTSHFFSYNEPLRTGKDFGKQASLAPLIQHVAKHLLPLLCRSFPGICTSPGDFASVEWWAHLRAIESGGGHQMHYDLDEAGLSAAQANGTTPGHPLISGVLFLSGSNDDDDDLPPTLVTDQGLAAGSQASRAWLCYPRRNRVLLFDGGLLHGVVPKFPKMAKRAKTEPRITLMLGFWGRSPAPTLSEDCSALGPNMVRPYVAWTAQPGAEHRQITWPAKLKLSKSVLKLARRCPDVDCRKRVATQALLRGPISPVWERVAKRQRLYPPPVADVQFIGRWFLEDQPCALQKQAFFYQQEEDKMAADSYK